MVDNGIDFYLIDEQLVFQRDVDSCRHRPSHEVILPARPQGLVEQVVQSVVRATVRVRARTANARTGAVIDGLVT